MDTRGETVQPPPGEPALNGPGGPGLVLLAIAVVLILMRRR